MRPASTTGEGLTPSSAVFAGLIVDSSLAHRPEGSPEPASSPSDAVAEHRHHRASWYAEAIGPLRVRDDQLAAIGRIASETIGALGPLPVSVVNGTGAGGLIGLARRTVPGVEVVAVESELRDLADLTQNVARIAAAARELDTSIAVLVGLPDVPGWVGAAAEIEAAGLQASIGWSNSPTRLAERMSVLIEADLAFRVGTAIQLGRSDPLPMLAAVDALIDGADRDAAAELLSASDADLLGRVGGWDTPRQRRIRRRLIGIDCRMVGEPIEALMAAGVLSKTG